MNKTKNDLKDVQLYARIIPSAYKRTKFLESLEKSLYNQFKALGGDLIIRENYSDTISYGTLHNEFDHKGLAAKKQKCKRQL